MSSKTRNQVFKADTQSVATFVQFAALIFCTKASPLWAPFNLAFVTIGRGENSDVYAITGSIFKISSALDTGASN